MGDDTYVGKHRGDYDPTCDAASAAVQVLGTHGRHAMVEGERGDGDE